MGVLTDIAQAQVKRGVRRLYGTILTRPALRVSDGITEVYACDVDIGQTDPTGRVRQFGNKDEDDDLLTGLPGQDSFDLNASLMIDTTLHDVVIARNNQDLIYADIGNAVVLDRSENGQWQITGFSFEKPGTYTLIPVNLGAGTIGTIVDLSIDTHLLTFGELGTLKPFGVIPFGASAIFRGGVLQRIA